jgi:HlyD family secretion protein
MTVRELIVDAAGKVVPTAQPEPGAAARIGQQATPDLKPGESRKEIEGVFAIRAGKALFVPVKTGIAGEKYFEVLDGLKQGDQVITGPFSSVRNLKDGDEVKVTTAPATTTAAS